VMSQLRSSLRDAIHSRDEKQLDLVLISVNVAVGNRGKPLRVLPVLEINQARQIQSDIAEERTMKVEVVNALELDPMVHHAKMQHILDVVDRLKMNMPEIEELRAFARPVHERVRARQELEIALEQAHLPRLLNALAEVRRLKAEPGYEYFGDFCAEAEAAVEAERLRIEHTRQLLVDVKDGMCNEKLGLPNGQFTFLSVEEGCLVRTATLSAAIDAAEELSREVEFSEDGKMMLQCAHLVLGYRFALENAVKSNGLLSNELWQELVSISASFEMPANVLSGEEAEIGLVIEQDMRRIEQELALQSVVEEVCQELNFSAEQGEAKWIEQALAQANWLQVSQIACPEVHIAVANAQEALGYIQNTQNRLLLALQVVPVQVTLLKEALSMAAKCSSKPILQRSDDSSGSFEAVVFQAQSLYQAACEATEHAAAALVSMDSTKMRVVVQECESIQFENNDVSYIRQLLALPESDLLQLQLKKALQEQQSHQIVRLTCRLKAIFYETCGDRFLLADFQSLKPSSLFSLKYGVVDQALDDSMLRYSSDPISTSLTWLNAGDETAAIQMFKLVMGLMGNRQNPFPDLLQDEVLTLVGSKPQLVDELFVQLMKQLRNNPSVVSTRKGWVFMSRLLDKCAPSEGLENYLEVFMRSHNQTACVHKFHEIQLELHRAES
jgi:hypothetical protein